ncbi:MULTISPECIES: ABC transporter substrate-binding protein [unclassified Haladaptatus]|uniref:ABC transporter substrate-binding protein n=1 Tax=unclassified Haladaptatus TaxID=2622732 RepID=UPI0023E8F448|nr:MULTISPECIES: ABC transporter substrate-binding protein [unclassified Haladaptatus]
MIPNDGREPLTRRDLLKVSGAGGLALIAATAGCLESGDDGGDGGNGGDGGGNDGGNDGGGSGTGGSDTLTIGMVDSITGSLAPYGERNERGRTLALDAVNAAGIGENGAKLEITVEDDESKSAPGVNAARKLVNQDGVPLLIGSVGSGVSIAMHDSVISGTDVVHISQNSTSPKLTDKPDLLRMSPSGAAKGKALAELIGRDHDNVAVTWINNDYGTGLSEVFEAEFAGTVSYNSPHDQGQASYRGVLTEMADTDASAWLFITYANEYTNMVNEAYDQGYHEQVDYYGAESTIADSIIENTEPGSQNGMTGITESAPSDQESYKQFKSDFEAEFDTSPTVWAAYAYDAVTVAAIAIEAADDFSGAAISEVVRDVTRPEGTKVYSFEEAKQALADGSSAADINYEGVSGPVDLDENGDPPGFYQIYRVTDHEYEFGDFITG